MNKTHTLIWSETRLTWVVAHEGAAVRGKPASRRKGAAALAAGLALLAQAALAQAPAPGALPTGAQVLAGQAAISQAGNTLTIQQATNQAILNWQSFNIGSQAAVNFQQPSASAVALNRVIGSDPSAIYGALSANGQVFLVNPNGVLFGQGARVDVGGLVASTLNIRNEDFLAGNHRFTRDGASAGVTNQGELNAKYVALLAPEVRNEGVIATRMGTTALAAGEGVTLGISGNQLIDVQVEKASINTLVQNKQLVQAEGGTVVMSAQSAHSLLGQVVNSGAVAAQGISTDGGSIRLLASSTIEHSGSLNVDAGANGKGGTAIVLADLANPGSQTTVSGSISARGGSSSGNGGFVETSGTHLKIADTATVNTTAANGQTGQWLLDPYDFTIAATNGDITGTALSAALGSSNVTIQTTDTAASCTPGPTCGTGNSSGNGDIFVNDAVSWSSGTTLTLDAWRHIDINDIMSITGAGSKLVLNYGQGALADPTTNLAQITVKGRVDLGTGTAYSSKFGSDGLVRNYTLIHDATGLAAMNNDLSLDYALGTDITTTGAWTPIGDGVTPDGSGLISFRGAFDGLGHTVSNISIANTANARNVGLFGVIDGGAEVRNVGVISASVAGLSAVGALAGQSLGNIHNSYSSGTVTGSDVAGVGTNTGSNDDIVSGIGGLVGANFGNISRSHSSANVSALSGKQTLPLDMTSPVNDPFSPSYDPANPVYATHGLGSHGGIGGLAGVHAVMSITDSYATGSVNGLLDVGGLVGNASGPVSNSYARGAVGDGSTGTGTNLGGLIGAVDSFGGAVVTASFWDKEASGRLSSAGSLGTDGKTTAEMQTASTFSSAGWDTQRTWKLVNGSYPVFITDAMGNLVLVYVRLTPGSSTYGDNPVLNWAYYTTADGSTVASITGTPTGPITWLDGSNNPLSLTASSPATSYTVKYGSGLALSGYTFNAANVSSPNWTVNKAALTITANNTSKTYGSVYNLASHTYTNTALKNGETLSGVTFASTGAAATAAVGSGSYAITGSNATGANGFNAANYAITYTPGTLTVNRAALTITANNASKTYGDTYNLATHTYTNTALQNGETLTGVTFASAGAVATAGVNGGVAHAITGSNATGGNGFDPANYTINYANGQLTVNPATLAVTINNASKTYGDTYNLAAHTYTSTALKNGNTLTGLTFASTGAVATASVAGGPYAITASNPTGGNGFNAGNYSISYTPGTLTVNRAALTITANDLSKQIDTLLTFTGTEFSQSGLKNTAAGHRLTTATLSSAGAAASATLAGSPYVISVSNVQGSGGYDANNYTISYREGKLTVNTLTVRDLVYAVWNLMLAQKVNNDIIETKHKAFKDLQNLLTLPTITLFSTGVHGGSLTKEALDDVAEAITRGAEVNLSGMGAGVVKLDKAGLFFAIGEMATKHCSQCQDLQAMTMKWFMQGMH